MSRLTSPFKIAREHYASVCFHGGSANSSNHRFGTSSQIERSGICWAGTNCDSYQGHGILYDRTHISHSRFCGRDWGDANANCGLRRHCPAGHPSECEAGEICFPLVATCNYVDLIGGPPQSRGGKSGKKKNSEPPPRTNFCGHDWNDALASCASDDHWCPGGEDTECPRGTTCFAEAECTIGTTAPKDDPSRHNFCGRDWNDAHEHCSAEDHWCPDGADEGCPEGKSCFAGTGCKYVADLFPTVTPTNMPTYLPTTFPPTLAPTYMASLHPLWDGVGCPEEYSSSREYTAGSLVCTDRRVVYKCKPYPEEGYCTQYAPDATHGNLGWAMLGSCVVTSAPTHMPQATEPYSGRYSGQSPGQGPASNEGDPVISPPTSSATTATPTSGTTVHPLWDRIGCPEEYDASGEYTAGSPVSTGKNVVYECKPYPEEGYCTQYAPDSTYGYLGWAMLGSCDATLTPMSESTTRQPPAEVPGQDSGEVSGEVPPFKEDAPVNAPPTLSTATATPTYSTTLYPLWDTSGRCPEDYSISGEYTGGSLVSTGKNVVYKCKPYPEEGHCNLHAPDSAYGHLGWELLGSCAVPQPTSLPSNVPSKYPTPVPSSKPTSKPTDTPTVKQTNAPSKSSTQYPTRQPTTLPTSLPSTRPTRNDPISLAPSLADRRQPVPSSSNSNKEEDRSSSSSSNNNVKDQETWQQSNDPDFLCTYNNSIKLTGYKATLDCRGYVYCRDGHIVGGVSSSTGVIACRQNQLFDETTGGCTPWKNVNTNLYCPAFDGTVADEIPINNEPTATPTIVQHKPSLSTQTARDPSTISGAGRAYSNPEGNTYFCGTTLSDIKRKCLLSKPCPGGFAVRSCAQNEGCFSIPSCASEYAAAAGGGLPLDPHSPDTELGKKSKQTSSAQPMLNPSAKSAVVQAPPSATSAFTDANVKPTTPWNSDGYSDQEHAPSANQSNLHSKSKQANTCSLCGNSGLLKSSEYINVDSNRMSCGDLASFLSENDGVQPDQCLTLRENFFEKCCDRNHVSDLCTLCDDSSLDRDAAVFFSGEEMSCRELENKLTLEKAIRGQCETDRRLYSDACCIRAPENPCHLCSSNGSRLNVQSNSKVSFAGKQKSCLDMHQFLYARQETSSEQCIGAQRELHDLCCESNEATPLYSFGAALPIDMQSAPEYVSGGDSPPLTASSAQEPPSDFMSWYNARLISSSASSSAAIFWSFSFLIANLLIIT